MTAPFVFANPGERRNQSLSDWDDNILFEHRHPGGECAASGVPVVALAVQRACLNLLVTTPAPADHVLEREPAAFSHLRQGYGGQARGGEG